MDYSGGRVPHASGLHTLQQAYSSPVHDNSYSPQLHHPYQQHRAPIHSPGVPSAGSSSGPAPPAPPPPAAAAPSHHNHVALRPLGLGESQQGQPSSAQMSVYTTPISNARLEHDHYPTARPSATSLYGASSPSANQPQHPTSYPGPAGKRTRPDDFDLSMAGVGGMTSSHLDHMRSGPPGSVVAVEAAAAAAAAAVVAEAYGHAQATPTTPDASSTHVHHQLPPIHHHHHLPDAGPPNKAMRQDEGGAPSMVGQVGMPPPAPRPPGPKLKFTAEDDHLLIELKEHKNLTWKQIADFFPGRSAGTLQVRYCTKLKVKTTPWTEEMVGRVPPPLFSLFKFCSILLGLPFSFSFYKLLVLFPPSFFRHIFSC